MGRLSEQLNKGGRLAEAQKSKLATLVAGKKAEEFLAKPWYKQITSPDISFTEHLKGEGPATGFGKTILEAPQAFSSLGAWFGSKATGKKVEPFRAIPEQVFETRTIGEKVGYGAGVAAQVLAPTKAVGLVKGIPVIQKTLQAGKEKKILEALAPKLTPTEAKFAAEQGKLKAPRLFGKGGGIDVMKDPEIQTMFSSIKQTAQVLGKKLEDIVRPGIGQVVKNINRINGAISEFSQKIVSPLLKERPTTFRFGDLIKSFDNVTSPQTLKGSEVATYNRVKERFISSIGDFIRKSGRTGPKDDFNDIWNARKVMDEILEQEFKGKAFGTPEYTGTKAAAQEFRRAFKRFLSDSFRYEGQMDKIGKMNEFIRASRARGVQITEEMIPQLKQQFGIIEDATNLANAEQWDRFMKTMSDLYDAKANIKTNLSAEQGKSIIGLYGKKHPVLKKAIGIGAIGTGGAVIGSSLLD